MTADAKSRHRSIAGTGARVASRSPGWHFKRTRKAATSNGIDRAAGRKVSWVALRIAVVVALCLVMFTFMFMFMKVSVGAVDRNEAAQTKTASPGSYPLIRKNQRLLKNGERRINPVRTSLHPQAMDDNMKRNDVPPAGADNNADNDAEELSPFRRGLDATYDHIKHMAVKADTARTTRSNGAQEYHHHLDDQHHENSDPFRERSTFLPPPTCDVATEDGMANAVVLVLSDQKNFIRRQAIRETWGEGRSNVFFVVGHSNCHRRNRHAEEDPAESSILAAFRSSTRTDGHQVRGSVDVSAKTSAGRNEHHNGNGNESDPCIDHDRRLLIEEQLEFNDLIEVPHVEHYRGLAEKLLHAYRWAVQAACKHGDQQNHFQWFVKVDDDTFVRMDDMTRFLTSHDFSEPTVIGKLVSNAKVQRTGKWAEQMEDFPHPFYPKWPKGSAGHIISRPIATYLASHINSLHRFQGEDAALGIWVDDAASPSETEPAEAAKLTHQGPIRGARQSGDTNLDNGNARLGHGISEAGLGHVVYVDAEGFMTDAGQSVCVYHHYFVVGHNLDPDQQRLCHTMPKQMSLDEV